jgi:plasmid stability protein
MSVTFSIKGVPNDVAAKLRERAERHRRSLQGELLAIIEAAAQSAAAASEAASSHAPSSDHIVGFDRRGHPIVRKGHRRIEEVAVELRARTPSPRTNLPLSVDILRELRDSR